MPNKEKQSLRPDVLDRTPIKELTPEKLLDKLKLAQENQQELGYRLAVLRELLERPDSAGLVFTPEGEISPVIRELLSPGIEDAMPSQLPSDLFLDTGEINPVYIHGDGSLDINAIIANTPQNS